MNQNDFIVLYIGDNQKDVSSFYSQIPSSTDFYHVTTPLSAINLLNSKDDSISALIIIENDVKGMDPFIFSNYIKEFETSGSIKLTLLCHNDKLNEQLVDKAFHFNFAEVFTNMDEPSQQQRLDSMIRSFDRHFEEEVESINQSLSFKIPVWKRTFDILASSVALLILSPIMLSVVVLLKLTSKGPILYTSKRVGTGYHIFDFYKFRTMKVGADKELDSLSKELNQYQENKDSRALTFHCDECTSENCAKLAIDNQIVCEKNYTLIHRNNKPAFTKLKNDPRITSFGRFLRTTSLDELPQLINILKGDMSVVGNRPLPLYEAEQLTTDQSSARFAGPSGLTGLWQVRKRGKKEMSDAERRELDNEYAKNFSFWLDLKLIIQTLGVFIQKENV